MEKTRVNSVHAFFNARDTGEFAPNPKWQVTQVLSNQEPTQEHRLSSTPRPPALTLMLSLSGAYLNAAQQAFM